MSRRTLPLAVVALVILSVGAARDGVTRMEFAGLEERVADLERAVRDLQRGRGAAKPQGFSARTEPEGLWTVEGVRFHNDDRGYVIATGTVRYRGDTFWTRPAIELEAFDGAGKRLNELIRLKNMASGTGREFTDVKLQRAPADAVVAIRIDFLRHMSKELLPGRND